MMRIIKISKADHTLEGIVYSADGKPDTQNEAIEPEDCDVLYDAMEAFNSRWEKGARDLFNLNHDDEKILEGVELQESYITDEEIVKETGDGKTLVIPECSWIVKLKLPEDVFDLVAGKATGLSMQGSGEGETI